MTAAAAAALTVATSVLSLVANAYEYNDVENWRLYANPYVSHSITNLNLNYYSKGYKAVMTEKVFGGSANYVVISQNGTEKKTLTVVNQVSNAFKGTLMVDQNGDEYSQFRVELKAENYSSSPSNSGKIAVSNVNI